jgi:hypothetical protein
MYHELLCDNVVKRVDQILRKRMFFLFITVNKDMTFCAVFLLRIYIYIFFLYTSETALVKLNITMYQ